MFEQEDEASEAKYNNGPRLNKAQLSKKHKTQKYGI